MVFAAGQAFCALFPIGAAPLEVGRGHSMLLDHPDSLMSRRHARFSYRDGRFDVTDLGSRNGSAVDGVPLHGTVTAAPGSLVRLGGSLFLCSSDIHPFRCFGITRANQRVLSSTIKSLLGTIAHLASSSRTLFIVGESGAGKETLAQEFHRESPQRGGPFVAVNCAAIPEGIAERLLFGARKGAFSGVTNDSQGYIEAADGGTLFLDEIAELDLAVQAKLLRVIETGELLPLGATRPRTVQLRVCSATHKDLRTLTQEGKFRSDLYFRIGMPQVCIPPLRERKEEIPWLIVVAVSAGKPELPIDVSLVESCILRPWPGNVRELLAEINTAAILARASGKKLLSSEHLRSSAGAAMHRPPVPANLAPAGVPVAAPASVSVTGSGTTPSPVRKAPLSLAQVLAALIEARGNISETARALQIHRTQLHRLVNRYEIDPKMLKELGRRR